MEKKLKYLRETFKGSQLFIKVFFSYLCGVW